MVDWKVRLFVGTRKGAYVLEGDAARKKWKVRGPYHEGGDTFMVRPDPREPGTVYAGVNNPFFGPMMFRSTNWGQKWKEVSVPQMPRKKDRKVSFDAAPPKWPVVNIWQIVPGREDEPGRLWLGIDPASLFRSDDRGDSWEPIPGVNEHSTRPKWNAGAGGLCLHTFAQDPSNPNRMYVGISAAGVFRSEDGGEHWTPRNQGVRVSFLPEKQPEFGQCVHKIILDPANPNTVYRQDHDGIYVSRNRGDLWHRVGRSLDSDFGFVVGAPSARPGEAFFVPLTPQPRLTLGSQLQVYRWSEKGRSWTPTVAKGQFPGGFGNHRDALATDDLDPPGVYFGTNNGNLFWTGDDGRRWAQMPYQFPGIHSVTVSGPESAR
ncbi:MAG: exo-alpha-sialidase [Thermoplasmata archaeon]|nr:exo-alpha-sialidase [Thermoplasmata archaeon]